MLKFHPKEENQEIFEDVKENQFFLYHDALYQKIGTKYANMIADANGNLHACKAVFIIDSVQVKILPEIEKITWEK